MSIKKTSRLSLSVALLLSVFCFSCREKEPAPANGAIELEFDNLTRSLDVIGGLKLNTGNYTTDAGETYNVTQLKYYISNLKFKRKDGVEYVVPDSYYLIDQGDSTTRWVTVDKVPVGDYTEVSFTVGLDSARSSSGVRTGALDPAKGMFLSQQEGYLFMRIEGTSPQSTQPGKNWQFHIGGFRNSNAIRNVTSYLSDKNTLVVKPGKKASGHYYIFISNLFSYPNTVRIANTPLIQGGAEAGKVADNYQNMFVFDHVHELKDYTPRN